MREQEVDDSEKKLLVLFSVLAQHLYQGLYSSCTMHIDGDVNQAVLNALK
jgi:hypothetical protein